MTCIVGLESGGRAYIGGDASFSDVVGGGTTLLVDPKVFHNGDYTFGCSGSLRVGQVVRSTKFPDIPPHVLSGNVEEFVRTKIVPIFRSAMEKNGLIMADGELSEGNLTILAVAGQVFYLQEDFAVARFVSGEYACGSGEQFALGSLHATRSNKSPRSRVIKALQAAADLSNGVDPPFTVLENV